MESRFHRHRPTSLAVPFLEWMSLSHREGDQNLSCVASGGPGQVLLQELFWQFQHRECLALEEELQHRSCHSMMGNQRRLTRPSLLSLIPTSECRQLERLCARIPPSHITAVLFRFRDILAHNAVLPWELVYIFKQVLKDCLRKQDESGYREPFPPPVLLPVSSPPADNTQEPQAKSSSSTEGKEGHRVEIPTISSYVDRHLRSACPYTVQRTSLPYCHSFPYDETKPFSTTL